MNTAIAILLVIGFLLFLALLYLMAARNIFIKMFRRPHPVSKVDRSPEKIDQKTVFGRGKNWFYSNRNEYLNVRIDSFDKTKLSGYFRPSADRNCRSAVILLHGYDEHPSEMAAYARLIMRQIECHVLITHMRGHGMSGGKYCTFGVYESVDLMRWIDFIRRQVGKRTRIYIIGRSMGATTALLAASQKDFTGNIAGIIAECPYNTLEKAAENMAALTHPMVRLPLFYPAINKLMKAKFGFDMSMCDCAVNADRIKVPVLVFAAGNDKIATPDMVNDIYDDITSPKRLVVVDNASHIMGYDRAPAVYEREVRKFVEKCVERLIGMGRL